MNDSRGGMLGARAQCGSGVAIVALLSSSHGFDIDESVRSIKFIHPHDFRPICLRRAMSIYIGRNITTRRKRSAKQLLTMIGDDYSHFIFAEL